MNAKPASQSRTLWWHLFSIAFLGLVLGLTHKVYRQGDEPSTLLKLAPFVVPLGGLALRFLTVAPLKIGVALLLLFMPACAEAKQPTAVLSVTVNGQAYSLPDAADRELKPIQCVAGDEVVFDLGGSEGNPDRFYVIVDNRKPGTQPVRPEKADDPKDPLPNTRFRLQTHAGTKRLRFIVSNATGFDEWSQPVTVLCKAPVLPDEPVEPDDGMTPIPPRPQPDNPPGPPPQPPKPDLTPPANGPYRVAVPVFEAIAKVKSPTRSTEVSTLATALEKIAKDVRPKDVGGNGAITNAVALMSAVKNDLAKVVPDTGEWTTARDSIGNALNAAYGANAGGKLAVDVVGGLKQPAAWAELIDEVIVGVRAVSK